MWIWGWLHEDLGGLHKDFGGGGRAHHGFVVEGEALHGAEGVGGTADLL